jgi:hypothetical protein
VVNPVCPPVPGALAQPQPVPELVSNPAWRDVAIYAAQSNSALQQCNADKQRIQEWNNDLD